LSLEGSIFSLRCIPSLGNQRIVNADGCTHVDIPAAICVTTIVATQSQTYKKYSTTQGLSFCASKPILYGVGTSLLGMEFSGVS
jgi:hypothetical protein